MTTKAMTTVRPVGAPAFHAARMQFCPAFCTGRLSMRRVDSTMLSRANDHQVLGAVVVSDLVDVVDVFVATKRPADHLFHHPAMLRHSATVRQGDVDITIGMPTAATLPRWVVRTVYRFASAGVRAKPNIAALQVGNRSRKWLPAGFTDDRYSLNTPEEPATRQTAEFPSSASEQMPGDAEHGATLQTRAGNTTPLLPVHGLNRTGVTTVFHRLRIRGKEGATFWTPASIIRRHGTYPLVATPRSVSALPRLFNVQILPDCEA